VPPVHEGGDVSEKLAACLGLNGEAKLTSVSRSPSEKASGGIGQRAFSPGGASLAISRLRLPNSSSRHDERHCAGWAGGAPSAQTRQRL
jgi:hypothetical protein